MVRSISVASPAPFLLISSAGHTHIDILKIDIESWEYDFINFLRPYATSRRPLPFGQLLIEFHVWNRSFADILTWWETAEAAGLRPYMTEVRFFFSFGGRNDG